MCILITSLKGENAPIAPKSPIHQSVDPNAWRNVPWGDIEKYRKIGSGSYGDVYEGYERYLRIISRCYQGKKVAVKIIREPNSTLSLPRKKSLEREIELQHVLDHPNCLKLIGVSQTENCTALILPLCEYSLNDLIHFPNEERKRILRKMTYQKKVQILVEIAEGIQYLHTNNRIHRDIKVPIK